MKDIKLSEFKSSIYDTENEQLKSNKTIVIDFYADWCQPCKAIEKTLKELEKEFSEVEFVKVDAEEEYELSEYFKIRNLPTLIIIDNKGNITSKSGALSKSYLQNLIKENIVNELV